MPRFPIVAQRSRVPAAFSNSARAEAADFGGGLGEAVAEFGTGAAELGQVIAAINFVFEKHKEEMRDKERIELKEWQAVLAAAKKAYELLKARGASRPAPLWRKALLG